MKPSLALFFAPLAAPVLLGSIFAVSVLVSDKTSAPGNFDIIITFCLAALFCSYLFTYTIGLLAFGVMESFEFSWLSVNLVGLATTGIPVAIYWLFTQEVAEVVIGATPFVLANVNLFRLLLTMPVNKPKKIKR